MSSLLVIKLSEQPIAANNQIIFAVQQSAGEKKWKQLPYKDVIRMLQEDLSEEILVDVARMNVVDSGNIGKMNVSTGYSQQSENIATISGAMLNIGNTQRAVQLISSHRPRASVNSNVKPLLYTEDYLNIQIANIETNQWIQADFIDEEETVSGYMFTIDARELPIIEGALIGRTSGTEFKYSLDSGAKFLRPAKFLGMKINGSNHEFYVKNIPIGTISLSVQRVPLNENNITVKFMQSYGREDLV